MVYLLMKIENGIILPDIKLVKKQIHIIKMLFYWTQTVFYDYILTENLVSMHLLQLTVVTSNEEYTLTRKMFSYELIMESDSGH